MDNKLFVASLSFKIRDAELNEIFASVGEVLSAKVILDRDGRSKGFGFVEMKTKEDADTAKTQQEANQNEFLSRLMSDIPGTSAPQQPEQNPQPEP